MLCGAHISGSSILILGCLTIFMILVAWCSSCDFTLPILLFYLPWSPLLKLDPTSYSFYTFGIVLICLISVIKKRGTFRKYHIKAGIFILFLTLLSKFLDGSSLTFDYIAFVMMIFLFPTVKEEMYKRKYDFYQIVIFFSLGTVIASICALNFADFSNIRQFIRVDEYLTIVRRSGFYGDANFYSAQILAALGGTLFLLLNEKKKERLFFLSVLTLFLLYCGFLSGSKSFFIIVIVILMMWIIAILKMRGRAGLKIVLLIGIVLAGIFITTSVIFSDLIEVLMTRFSFTTNLDSFTTGRIGLWESYIQEILSNTKIFFLGRGFTDIKINGRASHNTIIQMIFQFGLVGVPVLIYWITCFFGKVSGNEQKRSSVDLKMMIVIVGTVMPWLAIDILFFDEFFLLQWYILAALELSEPISRSPNVEKVVGR